MDKTELNRLLRQVADGSVSPEDAALKLKIEPIREVGDYAMIYGAGKTQEQILGIAETMLKNGQKTVLVTRVSSDAAAYVRQGLPEGTRLEYNEAARTAVIGELPRPTGAGKVVVATGGTSDIPVAEEAAVTAEVLGNEVVRLYDVGVSGLHRLLNHLDVIMSARCIVAVAGMEGAGSQRCSAC